jgi:hypothetical protein
MRAFYALSVFPIFAIDEKLSKRVYTKIFYKYATYRRKNCKQEVS